MKGKMMQKEQPEALLAQIGQGEPVGRVAWAADVENTIKEVRWTVFAPPVDTLLYVHPAPQQKPLTDEQIGYVARACYIDVTQDNEDSICAFARAIEAAHHIGEKK